MQYVVTLPSMAAVAAYHKHLPQPPAALEPFLDETRAFARGPYITALLKGNQLGADERAAVRKQLAGFTGLSEDYLDKANLRVTPDRFYKELLRDRGTSVGRLDARYLGIDHDNAGERPDNDPSFYGIDAAYTAAINAWARDGLGYKTDRSYVTIGNVGPWDWKLGDSRDGTTYVNVAPYLAKALRENSGLKIFVGQGYYDFATPFFGAEQALTRPGFPKDRVEFSYYNAGHMMYVHDADLAKLSRDIRGFIARQK